LRRQKRLRDPVGPEELIQWRGLGGALCACSERKQKFAELTRRGGRKSVEAVRDDVQVGPFADAKLDGETARIGVIASVRDIREASEVGKADSDRSVASPEYGRRAQRARAGRWREVALTC
jgi:hypothetical protein